VMSTWRQRLRARLPILLAGLWWGSLSAVGFMVVPLLFAKLATPAVAGGMAAHLFSAQTWVGTLSGLLLLMLLRPSEDGGAEAPVWPTAGLGLVLAAMLCALMSEFGVAPHIVARDNLKLWHSLGSGLYLLQWVLVGVLFWRLSGGPGEARGPSA